LTTSMLCSPLVTFTPLLVRDVFHGDAGRFSVAVASFGAGGLVGATGLLGTASAVDRRWLSSGFAMAYGVVLVVAALAPAFWVIPPLLVLAGASMTISNTSANTFLQSTAGVQHLGRTVSLYMLAVRGGSSIGALLTGAAVAALGVQRALLMNGLAAIAMQAAIAHSWRLLRWAPVGPDPVV
ncbi:MAG TPA: MFS transporter, partial [Vicinamibacterales bacterium]|nr:MFS transporter [Vicinamibacterales bacterium]